MYISFFRLLLATLTDIVTFLLLAFVSGVPFAVPTADCSEWLPFLFRLPTVPTACIITAPDCSDCCKPLFYCRLYLSVLLPFAAEPPDCRLFWLPQTFVLLTFIIICISTICSRTAPQTAACFDNRKPLFYWHL